MPLGSNINSYTRIKNKAGDVLMADYIFSLCKLAAKADIGFHSDARVRARVQLRNGVGGGLVRRKFCSMV